MFPPHIDFNACAYAQFNTWQTHIFCCLEEPFLGRLSIGDGFLGGECLCKDNGDTIETIKKNPLLQNCVFIMCQRVCEYEEILDSLLLSTVNVL